MVYWILKQIFIGPIVKLLFRPWTKGLANVPSRGPAILASNHLSFSDSIFLPLMVRRPVVFLAKQEYFTGSGLKGWLTAAFFRYTNQLPMDRSGGEASSASLDAGAQILRGGGLLGIYPEGTRSPDGRLYRGKVGVARLALITRVPVVPVAMIGTEKVQPIGQRFPSIRRVGVIIGRPLDFSEFYDRAEERDVQREVANRIMRHIQQLSAQEYVDMYAAVVKAQQAQAAAGGAAAPTKPKREPPAVS